MKKSEIDKDSPSLPPHGDSPEVHDSDTHKGGRRPYLDDPGQDQPKPSRTNQHQMTDYPGIKGPKVRDLEQDDAMDKHEAEQVKDRAEKVDGDPATKPLGKESRNDQ